MAKNHEYMKVWYVPRDNEARLSIEMSVLMSLQNIEETLGKGSLEESEVLKDHFLANHGPVEK